MGMQNFLYLNLLNSNEEYSYFLGLTSPSGLFMGSFCILQCHMRNLVANKTIFAQPLRTHSQVSPVRVYDVFLNAFLLTVMFS